MVETENKGKKETEATIKILPMDWLSPNKKVITLKPA